MNLYFEQILQVTLRPDHAIQPIRYISSESNTNEGFIGIQDVSELICTRLSSGTEMGGAVGYIAGCYKRLLIKIKDCTIPAQSEELTKCKTEFISFLASALTNPDLFGVNSENASNDLYMYLSNDNIPSNEKEALMKDLALEFDEDQVNMLVQSVCTTCFETLNVVPPLGVRSIFTDLYSGPATALVALCKSDKRYAKAVAALPTFCLDPAVLFQAPPRPQFFQPNIIETHGVQGAALEHRTLLGRIMRLFPDLRDPEIVQLFDEERLSLKEWHERNAKVVSRIDVLQRKCNDIVMAMLQSGAGAKENALKWLILTVQCLQEFSKSRPNPLISPSLGFAFNSGALALAVATPIWKDGKKSAAEKIRSIDMGYFLLPDSKDIFPPDSVDKIVTDHSVIPADIQSELAGSSSITPSSTSSSISSTSSSLSVSKSGSDAVSFITQSFFLCSRALYNSHAACIRRLEEDWRRMSHPHIPLPDRKMFRIESCYLQAALTSKNYSIEIVSYCVAGITALMLALEPQSTITSSATASPMSASKTLSGSTSAQVWKIGPDQLTHKQAQLLTSVPLSFISDIVTFLCFAADHDDLTSSIILTQQTVAMEHVLAFALFFLRRPSFCGTYHFCASLSKLVQRLFSDWLNKEQQNLVHHMKSHGGGHGHTISPAARRRFAHLVDSSEDARRYLAPCLLHLYGDIEKLLQHEKTKTRIRILGIVKQLWELPSHRLAFRGICCGDEFATFANGILSEINSLLADVTNSLSEIKELQEKTQTQEWKNLEENLRNADMEKLEMCESIVNHHSQLLLDVLDFLTNLSSDEVSLNK